MAKQKQWFMGEAKVTYNRQHQSENPHESFRNPDIAVKFLRTLMDEGTIEHHEEFWVVALNHKHMPIAYNQISSGGLAGTVVDIRHIMQFAILTNASKIILMHNHPSGNTNPSEEDIDITKRIKKACELMDIGLLDHIILTMFDHYSFLDEGKL